MTSTPSLEMRESLRLRSRSLQGPGSDEARMSKRRCTAEETLLTFWPPAPCARIALISTSLSEIVIVGEIFGMALILPRAGRLRAKIGRASGASVGFGSIADVECRLPEENLNPI